jgi:hypothetical protein
MWKINEFYVIQIRISISMPTWFFNDLFVNFRWKLKFCENIFTKNKNVIFEFDSPNQDLKKIEMNFNL